MQLAGKFYPDRPLCGRNPFCPGTGIPANYVEVFLRRKAPLLRQREEAGFVRDGHGDLHSEHICLTEPIRIYDCIEFNRRFRIGDIVADLGFLLMDLDFRRRLDLSERLRHSYGGHRGEEPEGAPAAFYKIYRAFVRGKVESFLARDNKAPPATRRTRASAPRGTSTWRWATSAPPFSWSSAA